MENMPLYVKINMPFYFGDNATDLYLVPIIHAIK